MSSVAGPHQFDADSDPDPTFHFDAAPDPACPFDADPDPDPTFSFDPDPDPYPSFQIKAQNLDKVLKEAHFPYILAYHLHIMRIRIRSQRITLMRIRILPFNLMRIHTDPDPQHCPCVSLAAWI